MKYRILLLSLQRFYKETLLFFDDIQDCKEALNTLKYFREDAPEYDVIAAGSMMFFRRCNFVTYSPILANRYDTISFHNN